MVNESPMTSDQELYDELSVYTLTHPSPAFLHQHVVDAYTAQHASHRTKPIGLVFALIGLYLFIEKGFTGRQVQKMHMRLANRRKQWPVIDPPQAQTEITVADVLAKAAGEQRDDAIRVWCTAVWETWNSQRSMIVKLVQEELDIT